MSKEPFGGVRNFAVASQSCPLGHITADKRLRYTSPKLPSATSFIRHPLYTIAKPKVFKLQHLKHKEGLMIPPAT